MKNKDNLNEIADAKQDFLRGVSFIEAKKHIEGLYKHSLDRFSKNRFDLTGLCLFIHNGSQENNKNESLIKEVHRFNGTTALSLSLSQAKQKHKVNTVVLNLETAL